MRLMARSRYTSATAAYRGNAGQHAHTAAMGARRNLCQSLAAELGSKGVHVCHINLDGAVDAPETIGKLMPDRCVRSTGAGGDNEIMGSQKCRVVGKSQPVLIMINPIISTRTRTRARLWQSGQDPCVLPAP
jgi:NAD(P)-dependent dehydrogenase (short-subunit alcohol dehydrogenase family)